MSATVVVGGRRGRVHPIAAFALRRLGIGLLLLVVVSMLVFVGTQVLPGDPATAILGRSATEQQKDIYRQELGLDRPLVEQYWDTTSGYLRGDLGRTLAARDPVGDYITRRLGNTLLLAGATLLLLVPLTLVLGVWAGVRNERLADHAISGLTLGMIAVPEFVTGTLLAAVVAVSLDLLPPTSIIPSGESALGNLDLLVLPVITLLVAALAYTIRMVRAGVAEAMASDYVQMARLNGMPEPRVVTRYALRNALAPTVQVMALTVQYLIGGVVIVETVFAYPGLGKGLVDSVAARDIPVVQAAAILIAAIYIVINIVADLIVVLLNPKLRTAP